MRRKPYSRGQTFSLHAANNIAAKLRIVPKSSKLGKAPRKRNWPPTCTKARYSTTNRLASPIGELMRLSKLSLLGAVATLALSGLSAHADSLSLGSSGQSMSFIFDGDHLHASGGNFTPSSAVIGGMTVDF